jgi:hypothetical protein
LSEGVAKKGSPEGIAGEPGVVVFQNDPNESGVHRGTWEKCCRGNVPKKRHVPHCFESYAKGSSGFCPRRSDKAFRRFFLDHKKQCPQSPLAQMFKKYPEKRRRDGIREVGNNFIWSFGQLAIGEAESVVPVEAEFGVALRQGFQIRSQPPVQFDGDDLPTRPGKQLFREYTHSGTDFQNEILRRKLCLLDENAKDIPVLEEILAYVRIRNERRSSLSLVFHECISTFPVILVSGALCDMCAILVAFMDFLLRMSMPVEVETAKF